MLLQNKTIFLTGGAKGIGYECAQAYIKEGANLVIADNDQEGLNEVMPNLGNDHLGIPCDVTRGEDVKNAIQQTLEKYGKLDVIHNNAGISHPSKALHETTEEEWDKILFVNLKSVLHTTRHGFEALKATKGNILNTSSMVGSLGQEIHAAYTATKAGMNALTKSMALDYAQYNIRVNAVAPAGVWTSMLKAWSQTQPDPESIENYLDKIHALGYCPEGDVIADVAVFLVSEKARFVTGCIMPVSGGAELGYRRMD